MPIFQVRLRGLGFTMGNRPRHGFYVNRFVEAPDEERAIIAGSRHLAAVELVEEPSQTLVQELFQRQGQRIHGRAGV